MSVLLGARAMMPPATAVNFTSSSIFEFFFPKKTVPFLAYKIFHMFFCQLTLAFFDACYILRGVKVIKKGDNIPG